MCPACPIQAFDGAVRGLAVGLPAIRLYDINIRFVTNISLVLFPQTFHIEYKNNTPMPLQAFDGALRGLAVGESVELQLQGSDWQKELLFVVPRDHPEIERLERRYKK
jgi:hypothetical protein